MNRQYVFWSILLFSLVMLNSCAPDVEDDMTSPIIENEVNGVISALPQNVLHPADNPSSPAKIELGRSLFWDPILSGNGDIACATCHHPAEGYGDGIARSIGTGGIGLGPDRTGNALTLSLIHI